MKTKLTLRKECKRKRQSSLTVWFTFNILDDFRSVGFKGLFRQKLTKNNF